MNIAAIFAGGVGKRMKTNGIPKQFLEINDVPIIIYTLRIFEKAKNIDAIVIAGLESHIAYLKELVLKYNITKVLDIVEGGETGQQSIINALNAAKNISKSEEDIVLIHDGVRPIIDEELINENIKNVKKYGTSISCVKQKETTVLSSDLNKINSITNRNQTFIARAPQSFYLKDILKAEERALENGEDNIIDSCSVMMKYGKYSTPYITISNSDNIKITTPEDYYVAEALIKARSCKMILGLDMKG